MRLVPALAFIGDRLRARNRRVMKRDNEIAVNGRACGRHFDGEPMRLDRLIDAAGVLQDIAEITARLGVVGFEEEGIAISAFRLIEFAELAKHIPQIIVRLRVVEAERQCVPISGRCSLRLVRVAHRIAEVVMRFRETRIELDRTAASVCRFSGLSQRRQDRGEIAVVLGGVGVRSDRTPNQFNRRFRVTGLVCNDAEQMQRTRMRRLRRDDLPAQRLRFLELAVSIMRQGTIECLLDRHRSHRRNQFARAC